MLCTGVGWCVLFPAVWPGCEARRISRGKLGSVPAGSGVNVAARGQVEGLGLLSTGFQLFTGIAKSRVGA